MNRDGDTFAVVLAEGISDLPEFHDCQRFLPRKGDDFGPLVAIWAARDLANAFDTVPEPQPGGNLNLVPVAVVHIWHSKYDELGLLPGFNCLYLAKTAVPTPGWIAMMLPLGETSNGCLHPVQVATGRMIPNAAGLNVRTFPLPDSLKPNDIPPVARWERTSRAGDRNLGVYYIGIRCDTAWCEVGSFPDSAKHPEIVEEIDGPLWRSKIKSLPPDAGVPEMTPQQAARVRDVKGWHDQQTLAQVGGKKSSKVDAVAFPQPEADTITDAAVFEQRWIPSAYLRLRGKYSGNPLALPPGFTRVELCRGTHVECGVVNPGCKTGSGPSTASPQWWAKLVPENGKTFYRCVRRHEHKSTSGSGVIPAGAVRWAWRDADESLWIRCADGCCTID